MAARESDQRLEDIWNRGGKTFSISRLNKIHDCPYEAYLHYVKNVKPKFESVYGNLGTKCHDQIELCLHGEATRESIAETIQDELDNLDMMGLEFPKTRDGKDTIRENWIANMSRFAEEFTIPKGEFITEELLIFPVDENNYMMGYADAVRKNADGTVTLIDWKTGHNYSKKEELEAGRQLCVYKKALELQGYKVKYACWTMVKYCKTSWPLKNGKIKEKVSEWRNLVKDLYNVLEKKLSDFGYDEMDSELYLSQALKDNRLDSLPKEVADCFTTKIYVRIYNITPEIEEETMQYIRETIALYEQLGDDWSAWKEYIDDNFQIEDHSFYCNSLCGYGNKTGQCKYWVDYCAQFSDSEGDDDLLS